MTTKNHFKVAPGKAPAMRALVLALILALVALPTSAGSVSGGDITLTFPDSQTSCGPDGTITWTGVNETWTVYYSFVAVLNTGFTVLGGGSLQGNQTVQFPYPDVSLWPTDGSGNRVLSAGVSILVQDPATGEFIQQLSGKWTVTCPPPGEGCTPGFWKNHTELWAALGYNTTDDFDTTFGVNFFSPDISLETAINLGGGGNNRLARHGVAALLSAASGINYPFTVAEVIALVQAGDANSLAAANELGCPLD